MVSRACLASATRRALSVLGAVWNNGAHPSTHTTDRSHAWTIARPQFGRKQERAAWLGALLLVILWGSVERS